MLFIKGFFLILFLSILFILSGDVFLFILGWERKLHKAFSWGFIIFLSGLQLIAYPLYRFNLSFSFFSVLYRFFIFCLLFSIFLLWKLHGYHFNVKNEFSLLYSNVKSVPFLSILSFLTFIFLLFYTFAFYYPTTDDGYYLTRSMEVIHQNSMGINVRTAWLGWSEGELPDYTDASTFVFFVSYLSSITGINAAILSKSFLAVVLLIAHFSAVSTAFDSVFENEENLFAKKEVALILYVIFQIFSVKESSAGIWMTGYIWNGKSLLPGFVFPMLLSCCLNIMNHAETILWKEWFSVALVLTAGVSISIVGLNLPIILYFCFGIAFLIFTKFKSFRTIWKGTLFSILPVLFYALLSYLFVITGQNDYYESGTTTSVNYISQFLDTIDYFQFLLYIFSIIYIFFFGQKLQKALFILAPTILLLTFLNPLFSRFVCKYVTTSLVYWRLWWLMPVYLLPSVVLSDLLSKLGKGNIQNTFICSLLSLFILSGFEIFRYSIISSEYTIKPFVENIGRLINARPELRYNMYGLNSATLNTAKTVIDNWDEEEKPRLLMYFNRPFEIRQFSTDIVMVEGIREVQLSKDKIPETEYTVYEFMTTYNNITDGESLYYALKQLDADFICFEGEPAAKGLEKYGMIHIGESGGIDLWRVN